MLFTAANKLTLATTGKARFEDRRIRISATPEVRADLHKLQKVSGHTGTPRFVADSDGAGHADRAWACFLALNAADHAQGPIDFTPVPALPRGFDNLGASDYDGDQDEYGLGMVEPGATW